MAQDRIAAAAAAVAENRLAGRRLGRLAGLETLEDGYAAQQEANRALEQRLGARAGHKIGGTTAPMRAYINVPEPIGGEVFASTVHGSGTVLPLGSFVRPGVETEIAVRLRHGLPPREQPYGRDEVTAATEAVMAAIEIVDDRYEDFRTIGAQTLLADNAFYAGRLDHARAVGGEAGRLSGRGRGLGCGRGRLRLRSAAGRLALGVAAGFN
jgi:2-keto-4-pentenoate hydratase